jgi:hypothetical protein
VYSEIQWSVLTAFRDLGNARQKRLLMIQPKILSSSAAPTVQTTARFNYNFTEPANPSPNPAGLADAWDAGVWDAAIWGGEFSPYMPIQGAAGMGRDVAIAVRGRATSKTTLVALTVFFEQGGVL